MPNSMNRQEVFRFVFAGFIILAFAIMFLPFITPILFAILFAFALEPIVSRYSSKQKNRYRSSLGLIFSLFLLITLPLGFVVYRLIIKFQEISHSGIQNTILFKSLGLVFEKLSLQLNSIPQIAQMQDTTNSGFSSLTNKIGTWLLSTTAEMISYLPSMILDFFIFTLALYFFLNESKNLKSLFLKLDLLSQDEFNYIVKAIQKNCYNNLVSTVAIGAIQALTVATSAWFCGYDEFFMVFVLTFICSLLPIVGAAPIAVLLAILSFIEGRFASGIALSIAAVIAGSVDNILKPLLMNSSSSEDNSHPVIALLALIGGVIIYGAPGLLLGPLLTELTFAVFPLFFQNKSIENSETM